MIEYRYRDFNSEWTNWNPIPEDATLDDVITIRHDPGHFRYEYRVDGIIYTRINNELFEIFEKDILWRTLQK